MVKCLTCQKDMDMKEFGGVEIDICPECGGVWLDGGELKHLTGLDPDEGRVLSCDDCGWTMNTKVVLGIEIDYCPSCGAVWLDPGELEKIVMHPPPKGNLELFDYVRENLGPKYKKILKE